MLATSTRRSPLWRPGRPTVTEVESTGVSPIGGTSERAEAPPLRICVLWSRLSGYLSASLRALADAGAELLVVHEAAGPDAPFDDRELTAGFRAVSWEGAPDERQLWSLLDDFAPDAIVVNSWHIGAYRRASRRLRGRTLRIVTVHNQWTATPKQLAARAVAPMLLQPTYDAAFVCDERQAVFAEKLGFRAERMLWGVNTCDQPLFARVAVDRGDRLPPPAFLFVGRLVEDKAIDVLAEAYGRYRSAVAEPWPLLVAGVGPMAGVLEGVDGVDLLGFVQPADLPSVFGRAGCLVLPSRVEPWGVVVHEAVSAGLSVVCTRACGAATRLVLDGYNGAVVSPGDVAGLTQALARISGASAEDRRASAAASHGLSRQFTPRRWAHLLLSRVPELRSELDLAVVADRRGAG
jgi:glycosyltransferase involved in cell wall biosynthesis